MKQRTEALTKAKDYIAKGGSLSAIKVNMNYQPNRKNY
jgi:hypothetical protein